MPVDKQVLLRYQVLNKCFRNRYREFTIDDLVEECNKAMSKELDKYDGVSKTCAGAGSASTGITIQTTLCLSTGWMMQIATRLKGLSTC